MPQENGITLTQKINNYASMKIIFVSYYSQYIHTFMDAYSFHFITKGHLGKE